MQLKLLNVARSSLHELWQDFEDYLKSRHLKFWGMPPKSKETKVSIIPESYYDYNTARYDTMLQYCREHNTLADYEPFFGKWSDEEFCNYALTLCHMIDKMMFTFMEKLEKEFVTEGGIKERMYRARTGYRSGQDERLKQLEAENALQQQQLATLQQQLTSATAEANKWHAAYDDLKERALVAYYRQQNEIKELKAKLGRK